MNTLEKHRRLIDLNGQIKTHKKQYEETHDRLAMEKNNLLQSIALEQEGFDLGKIEIAKTIVHIRGSFAKGGKERGSVIQDAIKQFATGEPVGRGLWTEYFGTKNYDRWSGQRSNHEYGYGPKHGSTVFAVEINSNIRMSTPQSELTERQIEAVVYFLTHLERIEAANLNAVAA